jgi:hypothetical protein
MISPPKSKKMTRNPNIFTDLLPSSKPMELKLGLAKAIDFPFFQNFADYE